MTASVPVWLVDRAFSDDEQNLIILTYATEDGRLVLRKERAITTFSGGDPDISNREDADRENLSVVDDPETREWYRTAVKERRSDESPE